MSQMFMTSVYGTVASINIVGFLLSALLAFVLGAAVGNMYYMTSTTATKGFVITLALIPPVTCVVVLLISGNFGAGLAVAGAFALIKFKSLAGTAKEMIALFISIGLGMACGTGFLIITIVFAVFVLGMFYFYCRMDIWNSKKEYRYVRMLSIEPSDKIDGRMEVELLIRDYVTAMKLLETKKSFDKNRGKKILTYIYEITFSDSENEDKLIEDLVQSKLCFNLYQINSKKVTKM